MEWSPQYSILEWSILKWSMLRRPPRLLRLVCWQARGLQLQMPTPRVPTRRELWHPSLVQAALVEPEAWLA
jgi:hypothetical protein